MPPHCQTQSWRLASTQHDNPASFLKVPTCRHRSQSSVVAADMVRHSVSPARGPPPTSRTRGRFASHEALPSRSSQSPIGESLADYEPLVHWKGINSVEQALPLYPTKNNCESYSRSERTQELERALGMSGRESLLPEFFNQNSTGEQLRQES